MATIPPTTPRQTPQRVTCDPACQGRRCNGWHPGRERRRGRVAAALGFRTTEARTQTR